MMSSDSKSAQLILCFGEALWDVMPGGMHPGGAPLNVAYHLSKLGYRAAPVTAVCDDTLGVRLLRQIEEWGLDTRFVTQIDDRSTGIVKVDVDNRGNARYEIEEKAAWAHIRVEGEQLELAQSATAIVFGTLALRGVNNKSQLSRLLLQCPKALMIYDVNLRRPYTQTETVWEVARKADVIKLTDHELRILLSAAKSSNIIEAMARGFSDMTGCHRVAVTAGAGGAGLLYRNTWYWAAGHNTKVKDTVGAGDAFLAGLIDGLLSSLPPKQVLENACRLGEYVVSRDGATPAYEISEVISLKTS
jgi:fructokinase